MKIAFIGLGIMGSHMAANLLKNDIEIAVYNRSVAPVNLLVQSGAKSNKTVNEVVKDADIVFSMLSTPEVVKSVFFGDDKVLAAMKEGSIWVDCSTVNPSFSLKSSNEANKEGVRFIDAPVAGSKPQAENAELVFFIGGNSEDLIKVQPYFEMMGTKVMHLGETGKGASFKMLVNIMLAQSMIIFSETILLGQNMGFDKEFLLDTIPNLVVSAPFTKFKAEMIKSNDYKVQFPLEWMYKDLHLATVTAYEYQQPLYLVNLAKELFADAAKKGLGRMDFAAIHGFLERNS